MSSSANKQPLPLKPIMFACPMTPPNALRQKANAFACSRGFCIAERDQSSQRALLCHYISCRQALQSLLWSDRIMQAFSTALLGAGVIVVTGKPTAKFVPNWFGAGTVRAETYTQNLPPSELALLLRAHQSIAADDSVVSFQAGLRNCISHERYVEVLRRLCMAEFVSAENERFVNDLYYMSKVKAWSAAGHATVLECHTGIEYFALFRSGICVLISIGVFAATDRPCTTLHDFVYQHAPLQYTCGHDMLGVADDEGQHALREILNDVLPLLGGPSMALVYAVSSSSVTGFRFAKVDLCRAENSHKGKLGDLSWISKCLPRYEIVPVADDNVIAEAMRAVHHEKLAHDIEHLLQGDNVPVHLLLNYDVAKAVRAIPHRRAINRLRHAALLSRRTMPVPTAAYARHDKMKSTSIIHAVDAEGRVVGRKWLVLGVIVLLSVCGAVVAAYGISHDEDVNTSDIFNTALAVGTVLLITLPQLYVEMIGSGYSIGELYRGCVPMAAVMRRKDVAFLKECVQKGADVEGVISGRHGCFLLGRARGNLEVGPVKVRDLDSRWDYGVNDKGVLCLRYRGSVGDMQMLEREIDGKMCRWWHCAVVGSSIVKGVRTVEVIEHLGDGEIG